MAVDAARKHTDLGSFAVKRYCIPPRLPEINDSRFSEEMMESHNWAVDKNETYGEDGILARSHCSRCGLGRLMILHNLDESSKK